MKKLKVLILVISLLFGINKSTLLTPNISIAESLFDKHKEQEEIILLQENDLKHNIKNHHLIAHAGGIVGESTYTNSKDAMDLSYTNGIRLIEIDFEWTTDNKLVCLHSWNELVEELFDVPVRQYSYEEFNKLEMINGLQQLTPDILAKWLEEHEDAYLVTDIKRKNVDALKILSHSYPHLIERIIPQIYNFSQYDKVLDLGYKNIILTLYMSNNTDEEIIDFARKHKLFAITMPKKQAETLLPKRLNELGIYIYTHTINDDELIEDYIENGVSGFYTDILSPEGDGIKKISQANRIYVELDGQVLKFVSSVNIKGNTFVPFRKIFGSLGANVEWDSKKQTAIGYTDEMKIELKINEKYAILNGKKVKLDSAAVIRKGNTMVPVRFVSETLGAKVDWDQRTSTVIITTKDR